jgi:hypothetical protein
MAGTSKNARTTSNTQKFFCPEGGEITMVSVFERGKLQNVAECKRCGHRERRPRDFSACAKNTSFSS